TTDLVLVGAISGTPLTGTAQFVSPDGTPARVSVAGQSVTSVSYSIASGSSQKIVASGPVAGGSIRLVPTNGSAAPTPLVVFSYKPGAFTVTEAGAPANAGSAFRMYVESSGTVGQPGNIQSGIAVAATTGVDITFELFNPNGTSAGLSTT